MPQFIAKRSIIDIPDEGRPIHVAIIVGFAKRHMLQLDLLNSNGVERVIASPAASETPYEVAPPAKLLKGREVSCWGRIARSSTTEDPSFHVACEFFQAGQRVGVSKAVEGKFGDGEVSQDFAIICAFK